VVVEKYQFCLGTTAGTPCATMVIINATHLQKKFHVISTKKKIHCASQETTPCIRVYGIVSPFPFGGRSRASKWRSASG
jgi:hypothetical protein